MSDTSSPSPSPRPGGVDGRWVIVGFMALVAIVTAYFVLGMPGMDHSSGGGTTSMSTTQMSVGPEEFETRMSAPDAFVVNVHVPDEGRIAGTDAAIPYDEIAGDRRLPTDRSTPILLYCLTGRMSSDAAHALMRAGYTNVFDLAGGMEAWRASGRSLD